MTLNLHGYHPTGESNRYNFNHSLLESKLFYFTPQELQRGHQKRIKSISQDIKKLKPDLVFFQEVGAGLPEKRHKTCLDFYDQTLKNDEGKNSVLQIQSYLIDYQALLACRGNIGWITSPYTFYYQNIYDKNKKLVYKKFDNPYPYGVLVEGFGILAKNSIEILDHQKWNLYFNYHLEKVFSQMIRFKLKDSGDWYIAVNIHLDHKIRHIEQAMAIRARLYSFLSQFKSLQNLKGIFVIGDFNSYLYSYDQRDLSMDSWFLKRSFLSKNFLYHELKNFNFNSLKNWASLPIDEFNKRSTELVNHYYFQSSKKELQFYTSQSKANCKNYSKEINFSCEKENRIDFILRTKNIEVKNSSILYPSHNWTEVTDSLSDHPGIIVDFNL